MPSSFTDAAAAASRLPDGFLHVESVLRSAGHPYTPVFLHEVARTAPKAANALGVEVGQIAKSVIFRRLADDVAVLVVASGDRRIDEAKVAARVGALGRADASFVKTKTGFSIGGVSPVGHATSCVTLLDRELQRFETLWAAAGHPRGVFQLTPTQLASLTGATFEDVTP